MPEDNSFDVAADPNFFAFFNAACCVVKKKEPADGVAFSLRERFINAVCMVEWREDRAKAEIVRLAKAFSVNTPQEFHEIYIPFIESACDKGNVDALTTVGRMFYEYDKKSNIKILLEHMGVDTNSL